MKIQKEIVINKPIQDVWEVLGNQFSNAHIWGSALIHTEGSGKKLTESVCDSRTCDVQGMGRIREKVLEFDPQKFALTYEVVEGFPFFVKRGVNRWTLFPDGNSTRLNMDAEIETKGLIGAIMNPMMKLQMSGLLSKTTEELKFYVENGTPHPRKQKALTKQ
jgi:carbon monoxide dehydrogenase subunit G